MATRKDDPKKRPFTWDAFECPECSANNLVGDVFTFNDEVFCNWCGQTFRVKKKDEGETFRLVLN